SRSLAATGCDATAPPANSDEGNLSKRHAAAKPRRAGGVRDGLLAQTAPDAVGTMLKRIASPTRIVSVQASGPARRFAFPPSNPFADGAPRPKCVTAHCQNSVHADRPGHPDRAPRPGFKGEVPKCVRCGCIIRSEW